MHTQEDNSEKEFDKFCIYNSDGTVLDSWARLKPRIESFIKRTRQEAEKRAIKYAIRCVRGGDDTTMTVIKRRIASYASSRPKQH